MKTFRNISQCLFLVLTLLYPATLLQARGLSRKQAEVVRARVIADWKSNYKEVTAAQFSDQIITQEPNQMKLWTIICGEEPADGRSLWISLHGGGGVPSEVNDQQWYNQKYLYRPAEGVYVAPRAPWDAWNMWCQEPIDKMYLQLISMMVCNYNVNPNKVHIMGYSAGGDGVWRMAPRMADRWASASMMAGHPGDVRLENLLNTPYMIWCGGEDAAYDRNKLDRERGLQMDSLQRVHPDGFIHETHILEGFGHWMERRDTVAMDWMAKYTRNPYPTHLLWQQEEVVHNDFYWISVSEGKRGQLIEAEIKGNTINILHCDYPQFTIWLCDEMLNLDKKVIVTYQGKRIFNKKVERCECAMKSSIESRLDPSFCFSARIDLKI